MQRQSEKKHTDENAHEADMQVLQKQPSPKTMPCILMGRCAQNAVRLAISEWYAEAGGPGP